MKLWDTRPLAGVAVLGLTLWLAGCGAATSEPELIASARASLANEDMATATVRLKSAIARFPQSGESRFLLGSALLRMGDPSVAAVELQKARDLKFDEGQVVPALARAMLASGQAKKLVDQFGNTVLSEPRAAAELMSTVAAALVLQGNVDRTIETVEAALKLDAKNMSARLLKARLTAGRGDVDSAIQQAQAVTIDNPRSPEAKNLLGELLWIGKGDTSGATAAFRGALAIDPHHLPAHKAIISMSLREGNIDAFRAQVAAVKKQLPNAIETKYFEVQLALADKDPRAAREGVQQVLRMAPDNAAALQLAGAVELQAGSLTRAEDYFTKVLQKVPSLESARLQLAETNLRLGQAEKAIAVLKPLLLGTAKNARAFALAGEAHLLGGAPDLAEKYFSLAASANPSDPRLRTSVALAQIARGQIDSGLALLESTAATDKSTFADLALISTRLQRKEFDSALTAAERLQKKQPNQALPFQLKGRILALRKDNAGARASLEHALSVDPAYLPAFQGLAELDIAEKQPRAAIQRYEALLAREPRNHYAMVALARLRQITGVSPEDVAKLLMAAVSAGPGEESPRLLLVDLRLKQRDFKGAKGAAQEAVSALPNSLVLQDALGRALLDGGETQQAVNIFRKLVVALPNDSQPYLRLADAYVSAKDFTAASQSLRRALETSPRLLTAQTGLVRLALTGRRFDEALGIARSVQKERPSEAAGWILEADVHVTQRRPDLAIESMRTALSRETTAESVRALHALYIVTRRLADAEALATKRLRDQPSDLDFVAYLGAIAQERQDYVAAETYFRRVLATKADDPLALNNLAFALVQQRKPEALKFAERAQSLAPDSATVMDTLASALASEEKTALALEWQRKAVSKAPDDPLFRLNLAKLLIKSGDRTEARGLLEGLAWLGPKFSGQSEVAVMLSKL